MKKSGAFRLGVDLGGTKTEGVVLDPRGRELWRRRIPTRREGGYRAILDDLAGLYREMVREIRGRRHTFGIGAPGSMSRKTGRLRNSNTLCLNGKPLARDLRRRLGRPLELRNDANCFALAEALLGAGRGHEMVFGVIMGTGCGGGIVWRGEPREGMHGIAGEWGHSSIDPNGPLCFCGRRGCVETFISGGGLERRWAARHGKRLPLTNIVERHRRGERRAARFMKEFFADFGRALANVIDVLDPDIVVLGGGVSNIRELYTVGLAEVRRHAVLAPLETPIVRHQLGDSAGVLGAALVGI